MQMLSGTDWAFHEKIQIIRADLGAVCGTRSKARNTLEFMTCGRKCAAIQTGCWPAMGRNLGRCLSHCCLNSRCYSTIAAGGEDDAAGAEGQITEDGDDDEAREAREALDKIKRKRAERLLVALGSGGTAT